MANCSKLAFGRQLEGSPGRPAFFRLRGLFLWGIVIASASREA
jgi:hypothetical protein